MHLFFYELFYLKMSKKKKKNEMDFFWEGCATAAELGHMTVFTVVDP